MDEVRGTVVVPTLRASEELVRTVVCCSRARPDRMRGGLLRLLCVTDVVDRALAAVEVVALAEVAAEVVAPTIEKLLRVGLDALWMLGRGVVLLRLERSVARFPLITVEPDVDADVVGMRATRSCRTATVGLVRRE